MVNVHSLNVPPLVAAPTLPEVLGAGVLAIVAYAVLGVLLLLLGYHVIDLTTPGRLSAILRTERNPNAALIAASGVAGVSLIVVATISGSGGRLLEGLVGALVFGLVGIVVQAAAFLVLDRLIGLDVAGLLREPTLNPATIVASAVRLGMGLIMAMALV